MSAIYADASTFRYKAYSQEVSPTLVHERLINEDEMKVHVKPQDPCFCASEDFIIFAEFSEVMGPVPLLTIPSHIAVDGRIDVNTLIMKIMSVDYQANASGQFSFCEDAQVMQSNVGPNLHAYVHYLTLHDHKARGFVRPLCIAYLTADKQKLHQLFAQLRDEFLQATEIIKYNNKQWFMEEISKVLHNVKEMQNQYFYYKQREEDDLLPLFPEEREHLNSMDIQQLVQQYTEYKHMMHTVEPLLDDKTNQHTLNSWKYNFMCNEPIVEEIETYLKSLRTEDIDKMGAACLRSVAKLSPWGILVGTWRLQSLLHRHDKCGLETSLAMFGDEHQDTTPQINTAQITDDAEEALRNSEYLLLIGNLSNPSELSSSAECKCHTKANVTRERVDYLDVVTSGTEASSSYHSVPESISDILAVVGVDQSRSSTGEGESSDSESFVDISESCISDDGWSRTSCMLEEAKQLPMCIWHPGLMYNQPGYRILKFVRQFDKAAHHILYSILIGRTIVLAGNEQAECKVAHIMLALMPLVPVRNECSVTCLRWHRGILVSSHIADNQLIGICVPERLAVHDMISPQNKNSVTILDVKSRQLFGPAYSGHFLAPLEGTPQYHNTDQSMLLLLRSIAAALKEQIFLFKTLIEISRKIDSTHIVNDLPVLKDMGLDGCDAEIIKYLSKVL